MLLAVGDNGAELATEPNRTEPNETEHNTTQHSRTQLNSSPCLFPCHPGRAP